jgi:hypothetical protein
MPPVVSQLPGAPVTSDAELAEALARAKASGSVTGKAGAEAKINLPQAMADAGMTLAHIDKLMAHPGKALAVGKTSMLPIIPGTPPADFEELRLQLQGGVFLQAYESLKGGGQITEVEGKKAEQAKARLSTAQTEKEFDAALLEFRSVIESGLQRMQAKAEIVPGSSPAQGGPVRKRYNPATGRLE